MFLNTEQVDELTDVFNTLDVDGSGFIDVKELGHALEVVGIKLPGYEIRQLINSSELKVCDDRLDMEEFRELYTKLKQKYDIKGRLQKQIKAAKGVRSIGSISESTAEGIVHTVRLEEQVAFSNWINKNLQSNENCAKYLPINTDDNSLYTKCNDGIILCYLINDSQPGTIHEQAMNRGPKLTIYQIHENLTLAIRSAQSIGCSIVNIGPEDLHAGKPHLVLGLLWQIIRIGLLSDIDLYHHPGLVVLLQEGETLEELMKLSPEQILIRWVNYHLAHSQCARRISNFTTDIKDSVAYIHLLAQIAPKEAGVNTLPEKESDLRRRAERMLSEADKIGCRAFVSANDVIKGDAKLNLAFVANLFNMYPALEPPTDLDLDSLREETREEKTYRNWMNSMGVSPYVNHLYNDLADGLVIFQLYDVIREGLVDWRKVHREFNKLKVLMEKIENCNYAVELGKQSKFSLVGIAGKDIVDSNPTLTLALIWQLMKAYTLSVLTQLKVTEGHSDKEIEKEIIGWANTTLQNAGKTSHISGYNDSSLADARTILDLVDSIKPGSVNYDVIKNSGAAEDKLENAKYGISMARRNGARIYALPEDIVEVKSKMIMTVLACLMVLDCQAKES